MPKRFRFLSFILVLTLLLAACGGGGDKSPRVHSAADAIELLAQQAADWGYRNAMSELTEVSTQVSGEHTFYRLRQNFHGIPVYGTSVPTPSS